MRLKVLYFASVRERLGCGEEPLELASNLPLRVADVQALLVQRGGAWADIFGGTRLMAAVNEVLVKPDHHLMDGDVLAFFPPVTGG